MLLLEVLFGEVIDYQHVCEANAKHRGARPPSHVSACLRTYAPPALNAADIDTQRHRDTDRDRDRDRDRDSDRDRDRGTHAHTYTDNTYGPVVEVDDAVDFVVGKNHTNFPIAPLIHA